MDILVTVGIGGVFEGPANIVVPCFRRNYLKAFRDAMDMTVDGNDGLTCLEHEENIRRLLADPGKGHKLFSSLRVGLTQNRCNIPSVAIKDDGG